MYLYAAAGVVQIWWTKIEVVGGGEEVLNSWEALWCLKHIILHILSPLGGCTFYSLNILMYRVGSSVAKLWLCL